jgi:hypothetical protein
MIYCNNILQCHDSIQKDNTMVQISLNKNEMFDTELIQRNLKLSSCLNDPKVFFEKSCANSNTLAQILRVK